VSAPAAVDRAQQRSNSDEAHSAGDEFLRRVGAVPVHDRRQQRMPGRAQHYQRRDSRTEGEGGEHRNTVAPFDHQRTGHGVEE
jgi:hypothetical protein